MNTLVLAVWALLAAFYLVAAIAALLRRPLALRVAAPTVVGNLLMAIFFSCFFLSRMLESGRGAVLFGYLGLLALFLVIAAEVIRRGRDRIAARESDDRLRP